MKKVFNLICLVFFGVSVYAQEVSLVTSGEGKTKYEATAAALRSAIEQSFGTFVSANTTILNEDVVRDEIATVASGNIKSYKEISCVRRADGIYNVSVDAVVSIGKLISYAKSHGSSAEFAGQTFAMEVKMYELNRKNEYEALKNLLVQLKSLRNDLFDYVIKVNNPRRRHFDETYNIDVIIGIATNQNYMTFFDILMNTLNSLSIKEDELALMHKIDIHRVTKFGFNNNDFYKFRNSSVLINAFAKEVCTILNEAQMSFYVQENGGNDSRTIKDTAIRRFHTIDVIGNILMVLQQKPGIEYTDEPGRIIIENKKYISAPIITYNYTVERLYGVKGFEVKKKPIADK